jgi:hypothetical protein
VTSWVTVSFSRRILLHGDYYYYYYYYYIISKYRNWRDYNYKLSLSLYEIRQLRTLHLFPSDQLTRLSVEGRLRGKILSSIPGPFSSVTNTACQPVCLSVCLSVHAAYWPTSLSALGRHTADRRIYELLEPTAMPPVWRLNWHILG